MSFGREKRRGWQGQFRDREREPTEIKRIEDQIELMTCGEPRDLQTESIINFNSQLSFTFSIFFFRFLWQVSCEFSEAVKLVTGRLFYGKTFSPPVTAR